MSHILVEVIGWMAAGFTLLAFTMHTMVPLRILAILSNACFIVWGALAAAYPPLVLHLLLLPFNIVRLWQIRRLNRQVRDARRGEVTAQMLLPVARRVRVPAGTPIFEAGDPADYFYFIVSGAVRIGGIEVTLGPGELFGEIAFFSADRRRTLPARTVADCEFLAMDEAAFLRLYYKNPAFAFRISETVTARLIENARAAGGAPPSPASPPSPPPPDLPRSPPPVRAP
jgi:CRP-like cAMP-binding protein